MPRRSTLSDANARRSEGIFEAIYRDLYKTYRNELSSDSRNNPSSSWINRLQIIDSTTISLFSNLIFTGVGRHPKTGKKKGGIKVHTNIHANEGVSSDIRFTSAATNDSFMLKPSNYTSGTSLPGRGLHRLRQVRGAEPGRCHICHQDEEESCL